VVDTSNRSLFCFEAALQDARKIEINNKAEKILFKPCTPMDNNGATSLASRPLSRL